MANRCLHQSHWLRIWHSISCPPSNLHSVCTFQTWWKGSLCTHTLIFENLSIIWNISQRELKYFYWKFDLNCPPTKIWPCLSFHKNFSKYCDWDSVWLGAAADGFRFRHFWQETPSDVEYHCSGWRPLLHYAIPLSVDSSVPQIDASPDPPSLPFLIRSSGESRSQAGFPLEPPHPPRSQISWPLSPLGRFLSFSLFYTGCFFHWYPPEKFSEQTS